jgi:hypothetical protein
VNWQGLPRNPLLVTIRHMETQSEDMKWIQLAHDGDQWQSLVNTVTNCQVPYKRKVSEYLSKYLFFLTLIHGVNLP